MTLAPLSSLGLVHRNQSTRCDRPTSLCNQAKHALSQSERACEVEGPAVRLSSIPTAGHSPCGEGWRRAALAARRFPTRLSLISQSPGLAAPESARPDRNTAYLDQNPATQGS